MAKYRLHVEKSYGSVESVHETEGAAAEEFEKTYPDAYYIRGDSFAAWRGLRCYENRDKSFNLHNYLGIIQLDTIQPQVLGEPNSV